MPNTLICSGEKKKHQRGYALITVLFGLAVITLLFTSASRLNLAHARLTSDQVFLSSQSTEISSRLNLALAARAKTGAETVSFEYQGNSLTAHFEDVGGLVDLNAASPALLKALLLGLEIGKPNAALTRYRNWRRQGNRLIRVADFARVADISHTEMTNLEPHVTVFSGRPGIAGKVASTELLQMVTGSSGSKEYLISQLPRAFRSPVTETNFKVVFDMGNFDTAIVYLPQDNVRASVLAIN